LHEGRPHDGGAAFALRRQALTVTPSASAISLQVPTAATFCMA
jgi:hypothetical protein